MKNEEQELIKRAQKGDSEAFGVLYDNHIKPIYRFVLLKTGNRADAEDITHQVFLSAWQNVKNYKTQGFPFSSWLYKIASNAVIDHWRTKKPSVSIELVSENFLPSSDKHEITLDDKLKAQSIHAALVHLEPEQQNVIILKFVDELSNKEIAESLGKSEGAVRVIQHRAIKKLKKHLDAT